MTFNDKVKNLPKYKSNEIFTAEYVAERIGQKVGDVQSQICYMIAAGDLRREGKGYRRTQIHWIHKTPISANPPKCFGERCWRRVA